MISEANNPIYKKAYAELWWLKRIKVKEVVETEREKIFRTVIS